MKYNLQPYKLDGDTKGFRDLNWAKKYVFPIFEKWFDGYACLDVGCGNGRLFPYLSEHFSLVVGIDPVEKFNNNFNRTNTVFYQSDLFDFTWNVGYFKTILFFGAFRILNQNFGYKTVFNTILQLSNKDGVIIIMDELNHKEYNISDISKLFNLNCYQYITEDNTTTVNIFHS